MDGYVHTAHCEVMPISLMVLDSMVDRGLPLVPDMFTSGHMAHGCGHFVRSVHDGIRSTAGDFVISAGPNLVVLTETTVDIVNLANENGEWRATGVDVIGKDGSKITLGARKEVIVSGGAYCSPAILLRSGIGAKAEVESFGIESKVDLLGVGKNLLDHIVIANRPRPDSYADSA